MINLWYKRAYVCEQSYLELLYPYAIRTSFYSKELNLALSNAVLGVHF